MGTLAPANPAWEGSKLPSYGDGRNCDSALNSEVDGIRQFSALSR